MRYFMSKEEFKNIKATGETPGEWFALGAVCMGFIWMFTSHPPEINAYIHRVLWCGGVTVVAGIFSNLLRLLWGLIWRKKKVMPYYGVWNSEMPHVPIQEVLPPLRDTDGSH